VGFDLDGKTSTGVGTVCDEVHLDYTSPTGTPGVDNQLSIVLPLAESLGGIPLVDVDANCDLEVTVDDIFQASVSSRTTIILVEVVGASSLVDDPCVHLRVTRQIPEAESDGDCEHLIGPGETFVEDSTYAAATGTGSIVGGHLSADLDGLPLTVLLMGQELSLDAMQARLVGAISASGITAGTIGGELSRQAVFDVVESLLGLGDPAGTWGIVDALTDLRPEEGVCQGFSFGGTFSATTATF
jgi:hypothetical protein